MKTINQGRPRSSYFSIIQTPDVEIGRGEEIKCINPKNQSETKAVVVDKYTYPWALMPDSFCLLTYGWIAQELRQQIESKFPKMKEDPEVRFLLLKEIK
ncbi:MAG: hypothetical protein JZU49_00210 [Sulfuricurvum sp.]|nr:hypothetical protein [Sulfuricurvum sp.]